MTSLRLRKKKTALIVQIFAMQRINANYSTTSRRLLLLEYYNEGMHLWHNQLVKRSIFLVINADRNFNFSQMIVFIREICFLSILLFLLFDNSINTINLNFFFAYISNPQEVLIVAIDYSTDCSANIICKSNLTCAQVRRGTLLPATRRKSPGVQHCTSISVNRFGPWSSRCSFVT